MQRRNKFWHPPFSKKNMVILFPIQFSNDIQSVLSFLRFKNSQGNYFRKTHRLNTLYLIRSHTKIGTFVVYKKVYKMLDDQIYLNTTLTVHLSHNLFRFVYFTIQAKVETLLIIRNFIAISEK